MPEFHGMTFEQFYAGLDGRCCYLQQPICQPKGDGTMTLPEAIGREMAADVNSLNAPLIRSLHETCALGPWAMMQLFVGNREMAPRVTRSGSPATISAGSPAVTANPAFGTISVSENALPLIR